MINAPDFHEAVSQAALGKTRAQDIIQAFFKDRNHYYQVDWNYLPQGEHRDKTPLWIVTFAASHHQKWAQELLSDMLSMPKLPQMKWDAASETGSTEGMTPFWFVMSEAAKGMMWALNAAIHILNKKQNEWSALGWNAQAHSGEVKGRTPLLFLTDIAKHNKNNLKIIYDLMKKVRDLKFDIEAQGGVYAGKTPKSLLAEAIYCCEIKQGPHATVH